MTTTSDRPTEFTVDTIKLSPEMAEAFLADQRGQVRKPRPAVVARYARDMESGRWFLGAGFIATGLDGGLVQGRLTCLAVIRTGVTIETVIFRNVSPEAVDAMDQNYKRQPGQILAAHGMPNAAGLAATVSTCWQMETGRERSIVPTISESLEWIEAHPSVIDACAGIYRLTGPTLRIKPSVAGPFIYGATIVYPEGVDAFVDRLADGADLSAGNPILTVRNLLIKHVGSTNGPAESRRQLALIIKAWNAWVRDDDLKVVKWLKGESFPVITGPNGEQWPDPAVGA